MKRKISELPVAPYKALVSDAERRGRSLAQGSIIDATAIILIGALDMIRELYEKIEALEAANVLDSDEKLKIYLKEIEADSNKYS